MNRVSLDYRRQEEEKKKKGSRTTAEREAELSKLLEQQWDEVLRALRAHRIDVYAAMRLDSSEKLSSVVFDWGRMHIVLINHVDHLYAVVHRSPETQVDARNLAKLQIVRLRKEGERLIPTLVPKLVRRKLYYREFVSYDDRIQLVVEVIRHATSANCAIDRTA